MRREPIFNCLKRHLENYEEERLSVSQYLDEHQDDLSDCFANADRQEKPLNKNQILFWGGSWEKFSCSMAGELFHLLHGDETQKYSCIFVARTASELASLKELHISAVLKDSAEHKELLATSAWLIGLGLLPASFIKKDGQVCVLFSEECEEKDVDRRSVILKDFLKADLLFAEHPDALCSLYPFLKTCGKKVLDAGQFSEAEHLREVIFHLPQKTEHSSGRTHSPEKKQLLLLANWKDSQESRQHIRFLTDRCTREGYEVTVLSPRFSSSTLLESFDQLNASVRFLMRGKMVAAKEELFLFRILEKHPELYVSETVIRDFTDELIHREYWRIWGTDVSFDKVLLSGNADAQMFFLAVGINAKERILVENGFLNSLFNKTEDTAISARNMCSSLFDRHILLPDFYEEKKASGELSDKEFLVIPEDVHTNECDCFRMNGKDFLICDEWPDTLGRTQIRMLQYPSADSVLLNATYAPDKKRMEKIQELLTHHTGEVFLIGAQAQSYLNFLPEAVVLDNYAKRWLVFLPGAYAFFTRFAVYLGDERMKYDVMEDILKLYNEIEKRR